MSTDRIGRAMRTILVLAVATFLLAIPAAGALAGQSTYNSSGSWVQAEAWLDDGSAVFVYTSGDGASAYLFREEEITCPDGSPGLRFTEAYGPASFDYDRRFAGAHADALLEAYAYEACGEEPEPYSEPGDAAEIIAVSLDWTGDGPLARSRGTFSEHVPGEYNWHSRYSSVYRAQQVAGVVGTTSVTGSGILGETRWNDHFNG